MIAFGENIVDQVAERSVEPFVAKKVVEKRAVEIFAAFVVAEKLAGRFVVNIAVDAIVGLFGMIRLADKPHHR